MGKAAGAGMEFGGVAGICEGGGVGDGENSGNCAGSAEADC